MLVEDSKIADAALENILNDNDFKNFYTEWGVDTDGIHDGDIFCELDTDRDKGKFKKMLEDDGFVLEDDEDGFWITGVKKWKLKILVNLLHVKKFAIIIQ